MGRKENVKRIRAEQSKMCREEMIYNNLMTYAQVYYELNKHKWLGEDGYNNQDKYKEYRKNWLESKNENVVYLFIDSDGDIIRIGSTKNLYSRVANYMSGNVFKDWGIYKWFKEIKLEKVLYINTDSREKAFALESELIKKYKPILNQNQPNCSYWDKWKDSLGDLDDIEELFKEYDISNYKDIYKNLD